LAGEAGLGKFGFLRKPGIKSNLSFAVKKKRELIFESPAHEQEEFVRIFKSYGFRDIYARPQVEAHFSDTGL
jgi:hypothetical protein